MEPKSRVTEVTVNPKLPGRQAAEPSTESLQQAEEAIESFYHEASASQDVPAQLRQVKRRRVWLRSVAGLATVLVLAGVAFFAFGRSSAKFGEEAFKLALTGPSAAPSGQEVTYEIAYTNDQGVGMSQLELNLRFPTGFTFRAGEPAPANGEGTRYLLNGLPARSSGSFKIRGQLVGAVDEVVTVTAAVTYEPANLNAQFTRTLTTTTRVVASVVNLEAAAPAQAASGQPYALSLRYRNSSEAKLTNLVLKLTVPPGFELEVPPLEPVPSATNEWKLGTLEPKAEANLDLRGRFTEVANPGPQEFRVAIGFSSPEDGSFSLQEERVATATLTQPSLTLALTANNVVLKSAATLGEEITYELAFANDGLVPYSDLSLNLKLDGRFLDWSSLVNELNAKVNPSAGTLTWTASEFPLLKALPSGTRGTVRFRVRVLAALPAGVPAGPSWLATAEATGKQLVGEALQPISVKSNEVQTKLSTKLSLEALGRYYSDQLVKLGSGPLPPKVMETTTYVLSWRLGNTLNDAQDIVVTANLPTGVSWTGQVNITAGQQPTFNPNTREVRWTLNRLPPGAGTSFAKPEATFEVAVTPGEDDADKILVLAKISTATATDASSGAELTATASMVTTELDGDAAAQGRGAVVR